MEKFKSYLIELTIVTVGVLIALVISNFKEDNQAKEYQIASIETIKNEVEVNYSALKGVIEKQDTMLDTMNKYSEDHISISDLLEKTRGIPSATLSNTGLELYKKNKINSIDFEMMSTLIQMNILSKLIDIKLEKLLDFLYPNVFVDSRESKMMAILYLRNVLQSEDQLLHAYEDFIDKYIKPTHNTE